MRGLTDKLVFFRYTLVENELGQEMESTTEYVLYPSVGARPTMLSGQKALEAVGVTSKVLWRVILDYSPDLVNEVATGKGPLLLRLVTGTTSDVLTPEVVYSVLRARNQRNGRGAAHHSSIIIEQR